MISGSVLPEPKEPFRNLSPFTTLGGDLGFGGTYSLSDLDSMVSKLLSKEEKAFLADIVFLSLVERKLDMIRGNLAGFFGVGRIEVDGCSLPAMVSECNSR